MTTNLDTLSLTEYLATIEALLDHPEAHTWLKGTYMVGLQQAANSIKRRILRGDLIETETV